jgi:hypothetical protein
MHRFPRILFKALVALAAVLIAVFYFSERSDKQGDTELDRLVVGFMDCLPETTTPDARDEIRGILDRYRDRALTGNVHPLDAVEIEDELRSYVAAGAIPDSLIAGFMSRVGKATRRMTEGPGE